MTKEYLFRKEYCGEEICDIDRDITEVFDDRMTPAIAKVPVDEYGMHAGKFRITVVWCSEDDCDCTGFEHSGNCHNHWSNNPNQDGSYNVPY